MSERRIVMGITLTQRNFIELVLVTVVLGTGLGLILQFLASTSIAPAIALIFGAIFTIGSTLYLFFRYFGQLTRTCKYSGFLVYSKKKNELIRVEGYDFSEQLTKYLHFAFAENPAFRFQWDKEPLSSNNALNQGAQLVREAAEYFLLDRLCVELVDYFNLKIFANEDALVEYGREDIPAVLLQNRFLETFSRPMNQRSAFIKGEAPPHGRGIKVAEMSDSGPKGEIVLEYRSDAFFQKFVLTLPKNSVVKRTGRNEIEIDADKLRLSMRVRFDGFSTNIPLDFETKYLGIADIDDITPYLVQLELDVSVKLKALFSGTGWEYYRWVDSFTERLEERSSQEAFFKRINWDIVSTLLRCFDIGAVSKSYETK